MVLIFYFKIFATSATILMYIICIFICYFYHSAAMEIIARPASRAAPRFLRDAPRQHQGELMKALESCRLHDAQDILREKQDEALHRRSQHLNMKVHQRSSHNFNIDNFIVYSIPCTFIKQRSIFLTSYSSSNDI